MIATEALQALSETVSRFAECLPMVEETGAEILQCLRNGGKILACGNGGSAADALHLAEEFVGRYRGNRPPLPALCLAADVTALTCIGNDFGFAEVFARQVTALGRPGDILVGFSTSGNSANILRAFEAGKANGLTCFLLTGETGGKGRALADQCICVPSNDSARIQELHTFVMHVWLEMVERESWDPTVA